MTNHTITTNSAAKQYEDHKDSIQRMLDQLSELVADHSREFRAGGRTDWGYPGDLAHIRDLLTEAVEMLQTTNKE